MLPAHKFFYFFSDGDSNHGMPRLGHVMMPIGSDHINRSKVVLKERISGEKAGAGCPHLRPQ
jgi:hypothetical protein